MTPIFMECAQVGLFMIALYPGHPLFWLVWAALLAGTGLQWFLMRRKRRWLRRMLLVGAAVGLIVCEVWYQMLNGGWETLIPMVLYSLCLILMIGTVIGWLIHEETRSWTKKSDR